MDYKMIEHWVRAEGGKKSEKGKKIFLRTCKKEVLLANSGPRLTSVVR